MMLSIHLVVDTGMNYYKWSLEKARQFMRENHFGSEKIIFTESLRYSVDIPAQASAYRMGHLNYIRIRKEIKNNLGDSFNIQEFRDFNTNFIPSPYFNFFSYEIFKLHSEYFLYEMKIKKKLRY